MQQDFQDWHQPEASCLSLYFTLVLTYRGGSRARKIVDTMSVLTSSGQNSGSCLQKATNIDTNYFSFNGSETFPYWQCAAADSWCHTMFIHRKKVSKLNIITINQILSAYITSYVDQSQNQLHNYLIWWFTLIHSSSTLKYTHSTQNRSLDQFLNLSRICRVNRPLTRIF